jgi:hypothetical protein
VGIIVSTIYNIMTKSRRRELIKDISTEVAKYIKTKIVRKKMTKTI